MCVCTFVHLFVFVKQIHLRVTVASQQVVAIRSSLLHLMQAADVNSMEEINDRDRILAGTQIS